MSNTIVKKEDGSYIVNDSCEITIGSSFLYVRTDRTSKEIYLNINIYY